MKQPTQGRRACGLVRHFLFYLFIYLFNFASEYIVATILAGLAKGEDVFIPRILFLPSDRLQFPVNPRVRHSTSWYSESINFWLLRLGQENDEHGRESA